MTWPHFARRCRVCTDRASNCCARRETKGYKAACECFISTRASSRRSFFRSSDRIAAFVRGLPAVEFAVSHWTRVEFSSLIAREVRMGGLDAVAARRADTRFETMLDES